MKLQLILVYVLAAILLLIRSECSAIKILDPKPKEIVNSADKKDSAKLGVFRINGELSDASATVKPTANAGNGVMSTGPVVYPDDLDDYQHVGRQEGNNQNSSSHSDRKIPQSATNNNSWVAISPAESSKNYQAAADGATTAPGSEQMQIVDKESRGSKVIKNFVPSPELKMPLTEEILHQNYMNDQTRLQIQKPQVQQKPNEPFQPYSASKESYGKTMHSTSTPISMLSQEESYHNQYQTQKPYPSTTPLNRFHHPETSNHITAPPVYQKAGSEKKYYPSKEVGSPNESLNGKSLTDNYQQSGNEYVRNEVSWPSRDKEYVRVQPQTVQEYVKPENWNKFNSYQESHSNSHSNSQYQIHEEEEQPKQVPRPNYLHTPPNPNPFFHHPSPSQVIGLNGGYGLPAHHHHSNHETAPSGLGQYKQNGAAEHPYRFESVVPDHNDDSKWHYSQHSSGHGAHADVLNGERHPFYGLPPFLQGGGVAFHHLPKHYESEVITSNEDGTITVKGTNYPDASNYEYAEHALDEGQAHGYGNGGGIGEHGGKHSKYLYFKKIASVIAGIIPIGLLISALTPNYVVINPNATSLNSPIAPFTLVQANVNRQRSLQPGHQPPDKLNQHPHLQQQGILQIPLGLENLALANDTQPPPKLNTMKVKNFIKLHKKYLSSSSSSSSASYASIGTAIAKQSKCIERTICELAAGNKNPHLLKSLLEELQRNFRNEFGSSTPASPLTSSSADTFDQASSSSQVPSSKYDAVADEKTTSNLHTTSASSAVLSESKPSYYVSDDDLLRAARGLNCSSYVCDDLN